MNKVKALFPDNVEKIIISKDDYDRLTGELTLENIELKQEIERLNSIIKEARELLKNDYFEDGSFTTEKRVFELLDKVEEKENGTRNN